MELTQKLAVLTHQDTPKVQCRGISQSISTKFGPEFHIVKDDILNFCNDKLINFISVFLTLCFDFHSMKHFQQIF